MKRNEMWRGAIFLQSLNITEYKSKGRYIISYSPTFGFHVVNLQFVLKIVYSISPVQANIM